ncbi:MAG: S8 family peptidase [Mesorhizobium sp.]
MASESAEVETLKNTRKKCIGRVRAGEWGSSMTQYVFIPDAGADPAIALASLGTAATDSGTAMFRTVVAGAVLAESRDPSPGIVRGSGPTAPARVRKRPLRILDVFEPTGVALVAATGNRGKPEKVPGGTLHPVVNYRMAIAEPRAGRLRLARSLGPAGGAMFSLRLRSSRDGSPVAGVVAQLRLKGSGQEIVAVSDAAGVVVFGLRAPAISGAVLLVEPGLRAMWGYFDQRADLASGDFVDLDPIDLALGPDVLRAFLRPGAATDGAGVRIGVIDSGVGPHRDLPNASGDTDTTHGHGTHVAGIIASQGPGPYAGIAPGAEIRSYRVFGDAAAGIARNYDIHKAIETAASDGCHLINLSLKSEREMDPRFDDRVISRAIEDAAERGVLAIGAAGNDFRRFVAFPARHPDVLSVSAFGSEPNLPPHAYDRWTLSRDRASANRDLYFANFSNQGVDGTQVDLTGPGAGIVSTVPGDGYAPMSGTSMACPAATGAIARLLSRRPAILAMPANRARTQAMRAAALATLSPMGFSADFEGQGMVA